MMKFDPVTIATVAVLVLIIALAATHVRPVFDNPELVAVDAPLHKNTELQLEPGETYSYSYTTTNSSMNITYMINEGPGCTMINIMEAQGSAAVCLDQYGERIGGPGTGFGDPTVLLFKPWMLALNDSWRWNSSIYLTFNNTGSEHVSDISYRVIRREQYMGRDAFVVKVDSDAGEPEYDWIDAEKRITLRIIGGDYEVLLKNWSS
jgi:hypothetical protein